MADALSDLDRDGILRAEFTLWQIVAMSLAIWLSERIVPAAAVVLVLARRPRRFGSIYFLVNALEY